MTIGMIAYVIARTTSSRPSPAQQWWAIEVKFPPGTRSQVRPNTVSVTGTTSRVSVEPLRAVRRAWMLGPCRRVGLLSVVLELVDRPLAQPGQAPSLGLVRPSRRRAARGRSGNVSSGPKGA